MINKFAVFEIAISYEFKRSRCEKRPPQKV